MSSFMTKRLLSCFFLGLGVLLEIAIFSQLWVEIATSFQNFVWDICCALGH